MRTIDELNRIGDALGASVLPRATREWYGADVAISTKPAPTYLLGGFYPPAALRRDRACA